MTLRLVTRAMASAVRREQDALAARPALLFPQVHPHLWWAPGPARPSLRRICREYEPVSSARGPWLKHAIPPRVAPTLDLRLHFGRSAVVSLLVSGDYLVAGTAMGTVIVTDIRGGVSREVTLGATPVVRLARARRCDADDVLAVCEGGGTFRFDPASRAVITQMEVAGRVRSADLSRGGSLVAIGDGFGRTEVWDFPEGRRRFRHMSSRVPVIAVAVGSDERSVLSLTDSGSALVIDLDGESTAPAPVARGSFWAARTPRGWCVARTSGELDELTRADGDAQLSARNIASIAPDRLVAVAVSERGSFALGGESGRVYLFDPAKAQKPAVAFRLGRAIGAIAFDEDAGVLAAVDVDGSCEVHRLGDLAGGDASEDARLDPGRGGATRPSFVLEGRLAVGFDDGTCAVTGPIIPGEWQTLEGDLAFSGPAAAALAAPVWAAIRGDGYWRAWDTSLASVLGSMGAGARASSIAVSPAGDLLVTGHEAGWVVAWDTLSGAERGRARLHSSDATALIFSADGRVLYTSSARGSVCAWELRTDRADVGRGEFFAVVLGGRERGSSTLARVRFESLWRQDTPVSPAALACARDDSFLAWCGGGSIGLLRPASGEPDLRLDEPGAQWWALVASPDAGRLASLSTEGECAVWDLSTRRAVARVALGRPPLGIDWDVGGRLAVTSRLGDVLCLSLEGADHRPAVVPPTRSPLPRFE